MDREVEEVKKGEEREGREGKQKGNKGKILKEGKRKITTNKLGKRR